MIRKLFVTFGLAIIISLCVGFVVALPMIWLWEYAIELGVISGKPITYWTAFEIVMFIALPLTLMTEALTLRRQWN
jgi:hypothetical protein